MPYDNIPGIRASFADGNLRVTTGSSQPNILIMGPAPSGRTDEVYIVAGSSAAEGEFGRETPLARIMHECFHQGADNISLIRSGGRQGSFVLTDSAGVTLTIIPSLRDDEALDRYALVITNDGTDNRIMVFDLVDETWVYDSSEIEVIDDGTIDVDDDGVELLVLNADVTTKLVNTPLSSLIAMADVVSTDVTVESSGNTLAVDGGSVTPTDGTDGMAPSLVERYAAYNTTYSLLDYTDGEYIIPADCYLDDDNVADDDDPTGLPTSLTDYGYFWKGVPSIGDVTDKLGFLWQYVRQGKLYTYFVDTDDYFSVTGIAASKTVSTELVVTAQKAGKGGNAVTIEIDTTGAPGPAATVTETDYGFDILVTDDGNGTVANAVTVITSALEALTLSTGVLASTLVAVSALGSGTGTLAPVAKVNLAGGVGGHALSHNDLTGDTLPSAVSTRFGAGADVELRECNFGHQLATHCYTASTDWAFLLGAISVKEPSAYSRASLAAWAGELPTYTDQGRYVYIDSPSDNGSGLMGLKLLAGESKTSAGYRSHLVTEGNTTDGYAYGGFILTEGDSLPNGDDFPYGINSDDERLGPNDQPVDIGRHIFTTYAWPILSNRYDGGSRYRGALPGTLLATLAGMPENQEPIGVNGQLRDVGGVPKLRHTQLSDLAGVRLIGIRREESTGNTILVSAKTAAHPDSDYTRASTIRILQRHLRGVRNIVRPYIGREFTSAVMLSMESALDEYLRSERDAGMNRGAIKRITFNRNDRILGRLTIQLKIVIPSTLEAVTVETSLAADESEL